MKGVEVLLVLSIFIFSSIFLNSLYGQTYTMGTSGSQSVTTCSGTFVDNGGSAGNYSNNINNASYTICGTVGDNIRFTFTSWNVENSGTCNFDGLRIYDGNNTSASLLGTYCTNSPGTVTSFGNCLHFVFYSDNSVAESGWEATISCVAPPSPGLDNSNWGVNIARCIDNTLLYPGVATITCGVTVDVPANERFVLAYVAMNEPVTSRSEITDQDSVVHHTDWLISNIGSLYGVAINESTATTYVSASSNYSSGFGAITVISAVLNYGTIGTPTHDTIASGTVYAIDPISGAASVFAVLPQRMTTLQHWDCEKDLQNLDRTDTGVGLGNIAYDVKYDQFFVTNPEDGRIYRLSSTGVILDSYDPFNLDSGIAGVDILTEVPYGIAVEPGSGRLFFGTVDPGTLGQVQGNGLNNAYPGSPEIYSIDLTATGSFTGTVNNSVNPAGATYDNYVGTETLHGAVPTSQTGGLSYTQHTSYFISDLAFTPNGDLMVGVRVGCYGSWHSSYNHWGETDIITLNMGTGLYSNTPTEYDISVTGDAGIEDSYGGVATYDLQNGTCDVKYLATSADVLMESGPHGVAIWDDATVNSPLSPMGIFSYGQIDVNGGGTQLDPKGAGGDIEIYGGCQPCDILGNAEVCLGDNLTLSVMEICPGMEYQWSVDNGATIIGSAIQNSVTIMPGSSDFTASLVSGQINQVCEHMVAVIEVLGTSSSTDASCFNGSDGTATITTTSGNSPFTYLWNDPLGQSTATANNLSAGSYTVTVTDVNGCSYVAPVVSVAQPSTVPCFNIQITRN